MDGLSCFLNVCYNYHNCIGGSVVEDSPTMQKAGSPFPASAEGCDVLFVCLFVVLAKYLGPNVWM